MGLIAAASQVSLDAGVVREDKTETSKETLSTKQDLLAGDSYETNEQSKPGQSH